MSPEMTCRQYAEMFGPTVGDQVRLADTDLFIEVERDLIAGQVATATKSNLAGAKSFEWDVTPPTATDDAWIWC